jgi:RHS repeat-associated protein
VILEDTAGNRYVYGLDLLTRIDGTDEEWYLYDGLGSTTGLADDTGAVTGTYTYDVFGAVRSQTGDATEWSYTGEQNDPSGLEYLRARYYDAGTGRFLNKDPLAAYPGWMGHHFAYADMNPVRFVDPAGLEPGDGSSRTPIAEPLPVVPPNDDALRGCIDAYSKCIDMAHDIQADRDGGFVPGSIYAYYAVCTKKLHQCTGEADAGLDAVFDMQGARAEMENLFAHAGSSSPLTEAWRNVRELANSGSAGLLNRPTSGSSKEGGGQHCFSSLSFRSRW